MRPPAEVAVRMLGAAIEYMEVASACLVCTLGHEPHEDDVIRTHDDGCPLRGYERTEDFERLRAWHDSQRSGNAGEKP